MKFPTTRFGEVECSDDVIMTFPEGILGFPDEQRYIMLEHGDEDCQFKWLQAIDNPDLAFIVIDPCVIEPRYRFEIDRDTSQLIGIDNPEGCAVMSIVNVPHNEPIKMTANMKAPLIVNVENRMGRQIILGSNVYSINAPLFSAAADRESAAETSEAPQAAVGNG